MSGSAWHKGSGKKRARAQGEARLPENQIPSEAGEETETLGESEAPAEATSGQDSAAGWGDILARHHESSSFEQEDDWLGETPSNGQGELLETGMSGGEEDAPAEDPTGGLEDEKDEEGRSTDVGSEPEEPENEPEEAEEAEDEGALSGDGPATVEEREAAVQGEGSASETEARSEYDEAETAPEPEQTEPTPEEQSPEQTEPTPELEQTVGPEEDESQEENEEAESRTKKGRKMRASKAEETKDAQQMLFDPTEIAGKKDPYRARYRVAPRSIRGAGILLPLSAAAAAAIQIAGGTTPETFSMLTAAPFDLGTNIAVGSAIGSTTAGSAAWWATGRGHAAPAWAAVAIAAVLWGGTAPAALVPLAAAAVLMRTRQAREWLI